MDRYNLSIDGEEAIEETDRLWLRESYRLTFLRLPRKGKKEEEREGERKWI